MNDGDDYPIPLLIGLRRDWTPRTPVLFPDTEQRAKLRAEALDSRRYGRRPKEDPLDRLLRWAD